MSSKPSRGLRLLSIPLFSLVFGLSAAGCSTPPSPPLTVPVAQSLRAKCQPADDSTVVTVGDLAALTLAQDAVIVSCDARRQALVDAIDAHNAAVSK